MPRPAQRPAAPILPPLMSPQQQQPSWKQEARPEPAGEKPAGEKPAENAAPPETPGENQ
jgi:hypothetical protein